MMRNVESVFRVGKRAALLEPLHGERVVDNILYSFEKSGLEIRVQLGCDKSSRALLPALNQAIRAAILQVITSATYSVTAEAAGSSPVVPAIPFKRLQRWLNPGAGTKGTKRAQANWAGSSAFRI